MTWECQQFRTHPGKLGFSELETDLESDIDERTILSHPAIFADQ
jgi:hypothetical protein